MNGRALDGQIIIAFSVFDATEIRSLIVEPDESLQDKHGCDLVAQKIHNDIVCPNTKVIVVVSDGFNSCVEQMISTLSDLCPHVTIV